MTQSSKESGIIQPWGLHKSSRLNCIYSLTIRFMLIIVKCNSASWIAEFGVPHPAKTDLAVSLASITYKWLVHYEVLSASTVKLTNSIK